MPRPGTSLILRFPVAISLCVLLVVPFLFVSIPPLNDVPGHMARAAIAAYASSDPVFSRMLDFHWYPVPNLGADLIVEALRHLVGITRAYWLVAALIPPLFTAALILLARTLNPRGAAAGAWALIFIYCYPFSFGFMNYMLGCGLALAGLVGWIKLEARPRLREALTWLAVPLIFLCHAAAGCLFAVLIASVEWARWRWEPGSLRRLVVRTRPLLASLAILLVWRLGTRSFTGTTKAADLTEKLNGLIMILRDQNIVLDIGSLVAALAVFITGWVCGARPHRAVAPALILIMVVFVVMPAGVSGSHYADMRLLPIIPMLAFATQDWSNVGPRLQRGVEYAGLALLLLRLGATTAGFIGYAANYAVQSQALDHIAEHSRVIVLVSNACNAPQAWRTDRITHFGDLAILYRRSWTNTQWDTDGAHLVQVIYRPSPDFYDDPSQLVWGPRCGPLPNGHQTVETALSRLPFDGIDNLWLIDAKLPAGYVNPRLHILWQRGSSTLLAVAPPAPASPASGLDGQRR